MLPIIRHLNTILPELHLLEYDPLNLTEFRKHLENLDVCFYRKAVSMHLVLNLHYSLLRQQLRAHLLPDQEINQKLLEEQLGAALMIGEFLEYLHEVYLGVPRDVKSLRKQKKVYLKLLKIPPNLKKIDVGLSSSQKVRDITRDVNVFRLFFIRSKRLLDLIALLDTGSDLYGHFVKTMDRYIDPILIHLAWFFYFPRLSVNLFLLVKHTVPGFWMGEKEKSLLLPTRWDAQMQRRWFDLGNDAPWVLAGVINLWLGPPGIYLSLFCFGLDVVNSLCRTYVELNRLNEVRKHYTDMFAQIHDPEEYQQLKSQLETLNNQIDFEQFRLISHGITTSATFLAMFCALPAFVIYPLIPVIGAVCLVTICIINFALINLVNHLRPQDTIEMPPPEVLTKLGIFAKKESLLPDNSDPQPQYWDAKNPFK